MLSDFIETDKHPLRELNISKNVMSNSKGLLILLRACKNNSSLRILKANDCSLPIEVNNALRNLVEAQQRCESRSVLQRVYLKNSAVFDSLQFRVLFSELFTKILKGSQPLRQVLFSFDPKTNGNTPAHFNQLIGNEPE